MGQEYFLLLSSCFLVHRLELGITGMLVDRGPVAVSTESLCVGGLAASELSLALMAMPTSVCSEDAVFLFAVRHTLLSSAL